jgi:hypothetical protein
MTGKAEVRQSLFQRARTILCRAHMAERTVALCGRQGRSGTLLRTDRSSAPGEHQTAADPYEEASFRFHPVPLNPILPVL